MRWGINTTWENLQIEKHKSQEGVRSAHRIWFVLIDLQIFSGGVYPPAQLTHNLFFYFQ